MNIDAQRRIVTGVAGAGIRVGQYVSDGPVPLTVVQPQGGNGPCWDGDRIFMDYFPIGLGWTAADGSGFAAVTPPRAATLYGAANGQWARFLADGVTGVEASWGLQLPTFAWLGFGPALFVKPNTGQGLAAYDLGSKTPRWTIPWGVSIDFFAESADVVIWTDGARRLQVYGLPTPALNADSINMPSTFTANGRRWLCYARGQGGFVIRPWDDANHGYIIVPLGQVAYGPTVIPGNDATHVIAFWGADAGETVIRAQTVDLTTPMQLIPEQTEGIGRPCWMGWFTFGASTGAPANCDFPVVNNVIQLPSGGSYDSMYITHKGQKVYHYVSASSDGDMDMLNRACADAKQRDPHTPTLAYWTGANQGGPPPVCDVVGVEAYWRINVEETIDAFIANRRQAIRRCPRVVEIGQAYTSNLNNTQDLRTVAIAVDALAAEEPRVEGILWFSDGTRPSGYQDHPEVHDVYAAIFEGIPGPPVPPVPPTPSRSSLLFPFS